MLLCCLTMYNSYIIFSSKSGLYLLNKNRTRLFPTRRMMGPNWCSKPKVPSSAAAIIISYRQVRFIQYCGWSWQLPKRWQFQSQNFKLTDLVKQLVCITGNWTCWVQMAVFLSWAYSFTVMLAFFVKNLNTISKLKVELSAKYLSPLWSFTKSLRSPLIVSSF